MQKQRMSWEVFDILSDQIVEHYKEKNIKLIVGIERGGLPLAVKLSHHLNTLMTTLAWQTRDGKGHRNYIKLDALVSSYKKDEVLFVDDICDSGTTIREIQNRFVDAKFTVLVDKIEEQELVDFTPEKVKFHHQNKWIEFPWEQLIKKQ